MTRSTTQPALDRAAVAAVDSAGQMAEILDLGTHLRDALWRLESAALTPVDAPRGVVIAGMGGSAIGGRLAVGAIGDRLQRPVEVAQGYALPGWAASGTLVLVSSYSGDTEEALACYEIAGAVGARRIACTTGGELAQRSRADGVPVVPLPGGFQPRAAVGYSTVVALEIAALAGAAPSLRDEVDQAAVLANRLAAEWGPDGPDDGEAKALARRLHATVPVLVGAELTAPIAYRWKCQLNENSKLPAFASELPELDHNEICGWESGAELAPFAAVFLEDPRQHPRNRTRAERTAALVADAGIPVERVWARGESALERLISLVLLGDLVSVYAAVLRGVDPVEIAAIDRLKAELGSN